MLVLRRKPGEQVVLGEVTLTVVGIEGSRITLGIDAPASVRILRGELHDRADEPTILPAPPDDDQPLFHQLVLDRLALRAPAVHHRVRAVLSAGRPAT